MTVKGCRCFPPLLPFAGSAAALGGGEQTLNPALEPDHMCTEERTCGLNNTGGFCREGREECESRALMNCLGGAFLVHGTID